MGRKRSEQCPLCRGYSKYLDLNNLLDFGLQETNRAIELTTDLQESCPKTFAENVKTLRFFVKQKAQNLQRIVTAFADDVDEETREKVKQYERTVQTLLSLPL